jgi:hypothetical protein
VNDCAEQPITLEEAANRVAALLARAEAADLAGRDDEVSDLHQQAFDITAQALQADPLVTVWDNNYRDGTDGD